MNTHPDQQTLTLIKKMHEYDDVYSFSFSVEQPVEFTPGMYAHVRLPDGDEGQRTRELSIASAPSEPHVQFTVHLWEGSPYKRKLAELREGDSVEIFKIKGDFVLPEDENADVVLIAGGIGVTPLRSMLIETNHTDRAVKPVFIHVARGEYLFEKELSNLPNEQYRISREQIDATVSKITNEHPDATYYVSGPPGFVRGMLEALREQRVPEEHLVTDEFTGYEEVEV